MPTNLKRTPNGYLFRKVIPKPLRGIIGKSEFKVHCGKVYAQALANYHIESIKAQQVIDDARTKLLHADGAVRAARARYMAPDTSLKPITTATPELVEQLRGFWLSGLEHDLAQRAQGLDDDDFDEITSNIAEMQTALGKAMARGQLEVVLPSLHQLLFVRGYVLALRPEEERKLAYDFLHAVMEGYEILKARHDGVRTPLPALSMTLPEYRPNETTCADRSTDILTLGVIVREFLDSYAKLPTGGEMLKKHSVALPLLAQMIGEDKPITKIRQTDLNRYFDEIQKLPSRWPDVCRQQNISVVELLKNEQLLGDKGMAPKTFIDGYKACITAFLKSAKKDYQDQGFPTTLTTEGTKYKGKRKEGENAQRAMKLKELMRLFEGPEVREMACNESKAHQFWLLHVGLFTGARINEVCQINPQTDIFQCEETGIWCMHITDESPSHVDVKKTTKNEFSKRHVPFHPVLIDLGILRYIEALRSAGAKLFFPGFAPMKGRASPNAERWVRELFAQIGLRDETRCARLVGFHAFRSTILSQAQEQEVDLAAITGHSGGKISTLENNGQIVQTNIDPVYQKYQGEMSLTRKLARLSKIQFPLVFVRPVISTVDGVVAQAIFDEASESDEMDLD